MKHSQEHINNLRKSHRSYSDRPVLNQPGEIWKPVPEWPTYRASNLGRIAEGRYIRLPFKSNGRYIRLHDGIRQLRISVAAIVLITFVGPAPEGKKLARHLDDNYLNNKLDNLAWGDHSDNGKDAIRNGKQVYSKERGQKISASKKGVSTGQIAWNKGKAWPQEIRDKVSASKRGVKQSPEAIAARSEGLKRAWARRKGLEI